jgi:hypothetical protein
MWHYNVTMSNYLQPDPGAGEDEFYDDHRTHPVLRAAQEQESLKHHERCKEAADRMVGAWSAWQGLYVNGNHPDGVGLHQQLTERIDRTDVIAWSGNTTEGRHYTGAIGRTPAEWQQEGLQDSTLADPQEYVLVYKLDGTLGLQYHYLDPNNLNMVRVTPGQPVQLPPHERPVPDLGVVTPDEFAVLSFENSKI